MSSTHAGRRVRGAFSFGSFLWASKERNSSGRDKTRLICRRRRHSVSYGGETPLVHHRRLGDPSGTLTDLLVRPLQ